MKQRASYFVLIVWALRQGMWIHQKEIKTKASLELTPAPSVPHRESKGFQCRREQGVEVALSRSPTEVKVTLQTRCQAGAGGKEREVSVWAACGVPLWAARPHSFPVRTAIPQAEASICYSNCMKKNLAGCSRKRASLLWVTSLGRGGSFIRWARQSQV